jgi:ATP-dependent 26S proteasome regulatory subunit
MDLDKEIDLHLRSRITLICVVSLDEERILSQLKSLCQRTKRTLYVWDHADDFQAYAGRTANPPQAKDPLTALEAIEKMDGQVVFVLRDFHQCWANQPRIIRKLRNLAQKLKYTHKSIIVTMPVADIPEELKDAAVRIDFPPPDVDELDDILKELLATPGVRADLTGPDRDSLLRAALGLSSNQAQRVFSKGLVTDGALDKRDISLITSEKKQVIRASGALEFYAPQETMADVGGLETLKEWLRMRERAFSKEASDYGLPAPKGIALIGIPGTGKSLTAKTVAALWRLPLIRLDIGALFGSLVGQSEENVRRALMLAETIAPCVLWIDEIEKGLSTGDNDGGTSMRVFGTILSWMQEKAKPVFVVATANNISRLPPELLRRGRFDEIFFLDLPTAVERKEIFHVHLRKRKRDPVHYQFDGLVAASEGYVGAEIEQAIIEAMYLAFNDLQKPSREFATGDILAALKKMVPLSRSQRETVEALREWLAEGRAQSASFPETKQAAESFVPVPIEPQHGV